MKQIPNIEETHNTREEWETVTWNVLSKVQTGRMSLADAQDKLDAVLHQQLQKARQDWLREEIVRLEGMYIVSKPELDFVNTHKKTWEQGYNHGISEIKDRYQAELDQPINSIFKE